MTTRAFAVYGNHATTMICRGPKGLEHDSIQMWPMLLFGYPVPAFWLCELCSTSVKNMAC